MTKEQVYEVWRPKRSIWNPWVKPVLFSYLIESDLESGNYIQEWNIGRSKNTAILVDLPGAEGVSMGVTLCSTFGFRPVPVYNACPYAFDRHGTTDRGSVVEVTPILAALCGSAKTMATLQIAPEAPPAFLIDANRHGGATRSAIPGWFDNRSFVTISDFPSVALLKQYDLSRVILIRDNQKMEYDLLSVLLHWQSAGITIFQQQAWKTWDPQILKVTPPAWPKRLWEWLVLNLGYSENSTGFGKSIPLETHGHG